MNNRYKLKGNIKTFNLGGMGCSTGVISVYTSVRIGSKRAGERGPILVLGVHVNLEVATVLVQKEEVLPPSQSLQHLIDE